MAKKNSHHRVTQRVQDQQASIQAGTDKARAAIRAQTNDSFVNTAARLGYGAGSQQDGSRYQLDFISRNPFNLEAAYRSNWLCGMVVDIVAEDMTRAGIHFLSDDLEVDDGEKIQKGFEKMGIWAELCNGAKWGRLYGGGIVVLLIDGQDLNTPLNLNSIAKDQFKGIVALDRWQVNPTLFDLVTDYGPHMGMPKYYDVTPSAKALIGERIHYSRCIRMDGLELPFRQRLAENGWGQSVLERLWDRVIAFDSTTAGAAQLVYKAHLRTMKVKKFRDLIAAGGKMYDAFIEQMKLIRTMQTNEGLTVIDGDDEFETHQYTFAGLDNLLLQFGQQVSGATQIPMVRLFGQSPAGLNSTGESDLRTYYDNIGKEQDKKLRTGLNIICELTSRSELGEALPDGFAFEFNPLWLLTDEQKANVAKTKTEAITAAEEAGIISPQTAAKELRQLSRQTGVFTHISDDEIDALEDEPPKPADMPIDPLSGEDVPPIIGQATADSYTFDSDFNEADHPRDGDGKFGSGGGAGGAKAKLSPDEKSALSSYSGDDFLKTNNDLRNGAPASNQVKRIDAAIAKSDLKAGQTLFRGMDRDAAKKLFGNDITAGKVISDKAFVSTSNNESLVKASYASGGVMLKIEVGEGAKGLDMTGLTRNPDEKETLLPRDAKMKILGVTPGKKVGDPVVVRVSYVGD